MFDTADIDAVTSELLNTGIFASGDDEFSVAGTRVRTVDDALEYLTTQSVLYGSMNELAELDAVIERLAASRETVRAKCVELAEHCAELESRSAYAHENEWQHMTSTIAVDGRKSERAVADQLHTAQQRMQHLPQTMSAWQEGTIHEGHVRAIERAAGTIAEEHRHEFEQQVLAKAAERTPQQLAPVARRIARQYEPVGLQKNHAEAFKERGVWITPEEHGMAVLSVSTSAVLADAILDRLRRAYKNKPEEDPRGMYQFMSDTAAAVLLSGTCAGGWLDNIKAEIVVTMPATMLTGESTDAADLPAGQLVDDETALLLAGAAASWTRLFTHPVTGVAVTADVYQPSASLRRLIVHRDRTCRFPGCARIAKHADVDHTRAWEHGGKTTSDNLACLCRHHHTLKHRLGADQGWRVTQTSPGVLEWIDPQGKIRRTEPEPSPTAEKRVSARRPSGQAPPE